jgi:hypothetical protein
MGTEISGGDRALSPYGVPDRRPAVRPRRGDAAVGIIAETIGDLTPRWFTNVLRAGGTIGSDASVRSAEVRHVGTGQSGSVVLATLEYDGATGAPSSLVVKQPSRDAGSRDMGVAMGAHRSEVRFYKEIAPVVDVHTPALRWSAIDEESQRFTIVLDDLSPGSDLGDALVGATAEQASLAIGALVALQAPLWDDPRLHERSWLGDSGARLLFGAVPDAVEPFKTRFGERIEPRHLALVEALAPRAPEIVDAFWKPPLVVAHGDYRLDNMFFGRTPSAPPVTIIDWQTTCLAPPSLDTATFLASSVDTDTRRAIEQGLIEAYVEGLAEAGVHGFGYADAWKSYRVGSLYAFLCTVSVSLMLEQTERGDLMLTQFLQSAAELVADTEAARLLD